MFGTTALDQKSFKGPVPGRSICSFTLSVGVQAKQVSVTTRNDYASDPSYAFPQASEKTVAGIGDQAVIESPQKTLRRITVKLGKNALQIDVDFYTQPPDESFLTQLAKDAVARV